MSRLYDIKITCEDRPGIIAAITGLIHNELSGNILDLNHHSTAGDGRFFLICRFSIAEERAQLILDMPANPRFAAFQESFGWRYSLFDLAYKPRIAVLVTHTDHCLYELILKVKSGYLKAEICCVVSNRDTLEPVARQFGLPFHHHPIEGDRRRQEESVQETLSHYRADSLVLARYMQVLSPSFLERWKDQVINVHHGFLPAFKGARPYHQAWEKGVKVIGATAHYATEDLDEGPIIYQDVIPVRDNLSVQGFIESGQDIERKVLVEGLKLHLERRVFIHQGRTIIL